METLDRCRRDCCPQMFFDKDKNLIIIKDDFGGTVSLTPEQFELLGNVYSRHFFKGAKDDGN